MNRNDFNEALKCENVGTVLSSTGKLFQKWMGVNLDVFFTVVSANGW